MIYTSYFSNKKLLDDDNMVKVRISIWPPRWRLPYKISGKIPELMPMRSMLNLQYDFYREFYIEILNSVGAQKITSLISQFGENVVLLCFENLSKPNAWCHRRIFANWYEEKTGTKINELPN